MPDIAAEAGVALKTVYVVFETKVGLLRAVWEARFGGDEEAVPVFDRTWYRALVAEQDPDRKLRLVAAQSVRVKTGSGALLEAIRNASFTDPEIAVLWDDIERKLLDVARSIVKQLSDGKALATGLTIPDATDILWTLNHPTVWHLTVRARGWSPKRYERWLGDVLCTQLLGRTASSSG
jgi:AcrR family transcriptional regulator